MILRSPSRELVALLSILLFSNSPFFIYSQSDFDCHITINDTKFDLTSLTGEHIVNRTRSTPPTTMIDSLRFDLCADLKRIDGLAEHDQVRPTRRIREPASIYPIYYYYYFTNSECFASVLQAQERASPKSTAKKTNLTV